jgi:hypothetical protein
MLKYLSLVVNQLARLSCSLFVRTLQEPMNTHCRPTALAGTLLPMGGLELLVLRRFKRAKPMKVAK